MYTVEIRIPNMPLITLEANSMKNLLMGLMETQLRLLEQIIIQDNKVN